MSLSLLCLTLLDKRSRCESGMNRKGEAIATRMEHAVLVIEVNRLALREEHVGPWEAWERERHQWSSIFQSYPWTIPHEGRHSGELLLNKQTLNSIDCWVCCTPLHSSDYNWLPFPLSLVGNQLKTAGNVPALAPTMQNMSTPPGIFPTPILVAFTSHFVA